MRIIGILFGESHSGCVSTLGIIGILGAVLIPIGVAINFWDSHPILFSFFLGLVIAFIAVRLMKRYCKNLSNVVILTIGALIVAVVTGALFGAFSMGDIYQDRLYTLKLNGEFIQLSPRQYQGITVFENWEKDCFIDEAEINKRCPQVTCRVQNDTEGTLTVRKLGMNYNAQRGLIEVQRTDTGETASFNGFYVAYSTGKQEMYLPAKEVIEWLGITLKKDGTVIELWTN